MASSRKKKRPRAKAKKPTKRKVSHSKGSKLRRKTAKRKTPRKAKHKPRKTAPRAHVKTVAEVVAFLKAQILASTPPSSTHIPIAVLVPLLKPTPMSTILAALENLAGEGLITLQPDNSFVVNPPPATLPH